MPTDLLAVAHIFGWLVIIILGLVVWVLTRQLSTLYSRIAPAGALMINARLRIGERAPLVTARRLDGGSRQVGTPLAGLEQQAQELRPQLLVFIAPDCPISRSLLSAIRSIARTESWLDVVLASDGDDKTAHRTLVAEHKLAGFDYLLSEELGRVYGVSKIPYAVLIDEHGDVASMGIVNSREHLESLLEAKERGVESLQEYLNRDEIDDFTHRA